MTLRKASLTMAAVATTLAAATISDRAAAAIVFDTGYRFTGPSSGFYLGLNRAPQPGRSLPGATSRPSNRGMRVSPSMGGRGLTRGLRGGRMNGSMRRR
jgi:hypothetical protein